MEPVPSYRSDWCDPRWCLPGTALRPRRAFYALQRVWNAEKAQKVTATWQLGDFEADWSHKLQIKDRALPRRLTAARRG